ncbi:MAG TPA: type II secretion system F family protein [Candidatus Paceibacterota bacterium]|nr:type II secretion system F family protein [Candidatus Paceibacterota bacterium]HOL53905.1 type II secretion system F family protein [Candidatus Paceibacterota bacterium]HPP16795.1 type II secretion system F family protein [Candidatus Paceibacterota bacterium]
MLFKYRASTKDGKIVEGEGDFANEDAVLAYLKAQDLNPINLQLVATKSKLRSRLFGSPININDQIFLTRDLALMLKVGTDIFKAIDILIADYDKPAVRSLLIEIRENLSKGQPFYTTFAKYPKIFSPVFTNLIRAGEASGNLESVFEELSVTLEKQRDLQQRIKSALIYPVLLVVASIGIIALLVTFAIPKMATLFQGGDMPLPPVTKVIFNISFFLSQYGLYILIGVIALIVGAVMFYKMSLVGRTFFQHLAYRLPVVKGVLSKMAYQRFATTFGSLMRAGLPILENLEITATTVGYEEMRQALLRIAHEGVARGISLGDAFRNEEIFPQTIRTLISIGEKAGRTDEVLKTLSDFYDTEIDAAVKSLVAIFEPIMLIFIGVIVGGIALAVILPVYQFTNQLGGI